MTALLTMDEVAAELRVSRRWLQDFVQEFPYYRHAGRKKLFTAEDVARLIEAMPCPGNSSRRAKARPHSGTSGASTSASLLTEVRALARGERPPRSSAHGSGRPSEASTPSPTKRLTLVPS